MGDPLAVDGHEAQHRARVQLTDPLAGQPNTAGDQREGDALVSGPADRPDKLVSSVAQVVLGRPYPVGRLLCLVEQFRLRLIVWGSARLSHRGKAISLRERNAICVLASYIDASQACGHAKGGLLAGHPHDCARPAVDEGAAAAADMEGRDAAGRPVPARVDALLPLDRAHRRPQQGVAVTDRWLWRRLGQSTRRLATLRFGCRREGSSRLIETRLHGLVRKGGGRQSSDGNLLGCGDVRVRHRHVVHERVDLSGRR